MKYYICGNILVMGYPYELITISCFILSFPRIIVITCDPYSLASYMTDEVINKGILFPSISREVGVAVVREGVVEELAKGHGDIRTKELMHMSEEETKEYVAQRNYVIMASAIYNCEND
ncbi:hypothetical protein GIB67_024256 [Kingdonia uniflora]|uniref:Uncharacterized protein n=1 Tax=Kingdonia uniflora TaxID=39325 RepID=A0A7J7LZL2_9MAGN|nr:hypothetical protein GIB67_024256 [Kingdonia uniflora]